MSSLSLLILSIFSFLFYLLILPEICASRSFQIIVLRGFVGLLSFASILIIYDLYYLLTTILGRFIILFYIVTLDVWLIIFKK